MNKVVNNFLLAIFFFVFFFLPPRFTYSACGPFTEKTERIQKFKEVRDSRYVYQNALDKACFQQDMAYEVYDFIT